MEQPLLLAARVGRYAKAANLAANKVKQVIGEGAGGGQGEAGGGQGESQAERGGSAIAAARFPQKSAYRGQTLKR